MTKARATASPTDVGLFIDWRTLAMLLHGIFVDDPKTGIELMQDWVDNDPSGWVEWLQQMIRMVHVWEQVGEALHIDSDELPF